MLFLKKSPTLLTGLVVLLVTVVLLGGRSLIMGVSAEASEPTGRQTANVNVASVAVANVSDGSGQVPAGCCGGGSEASPAQGDAAYSAQGSGGGCCGGG